MYFDNPVVPEHPMHECPLKFAAKHLYTHTRSSQVGQSYQTFVNGLVLQLQQFCPSNPDCAHTLSPHPGQS